MSLRGAVGASATGLTGSTAAVAGIETLPTLPTLSAAEARELRSSAAKAGSRASVATGAFDESTVSSFGVEDTAVCARAAAPWAMTGRRGVTACRLDFSILIVAREGDFAGRRGPCDPSRAADRGPPAVSPGSVEVRGGETAFNGTGLAGLASNGLLSGTGSFTPIHALHRLLQAGRSFDSSARPDAGISTHISDSKTTERIMLPASPTLGPERIS